MLILDYLKFLIKPIFHLTFHLTFHPFQAIVKFQVRVSSLPLSSFLACFNFFPLKMITASSKHMR